MPDPISFTSASPRFALPLLFAGQAQKEFYVNEAHALVDALLHCAIEGERADPPSGPSEGECWLVAATATGEWAGREGTIACRETGSWLFATPRDGMRVLDRSTGQEIRFRTEWHRPSRPAEPSGGTTTDIEARTAISQIITALVSSGILPDR